MRTVFAVVAGVVAMSAVYAAPDVEDGVLVLTDDNFDDAVAENENILVEFYAPWCGHCKKLAPEYAQAAGMLEKQDIDAKLAKVDATEEKELASRFEVQGFPTLKFFKGGKAREYKGPREAAGIAAWVKKNSGPAATTLDSAADVTKFVANGGDAVAVAYVHDVDGAKDAAAAAYLEAAANVDDVDFAIIADEEAANKAEVRAPAFVMYTEFDEGRSDYEGEEDDASAIEAWARGASLPTVVKFTPESAPKIFGGPVKTHFLVFSDDDETETHEAVLAQLTAVGKAHKGEILAIHVPPEEDRVMGYFEVTKDDLPAAVLVSMPADAPMKKFPFDGDVTEEGGLSGFAKKFLDGELKPVLKSEEVAPEDTEGDVVVVKGKSFADIVLAEDKDVLLEFYAPWCGHCKQLAPTYEKLGAKFADVEGVTIAKIDATANEVEHPGVNVRGFPTILFFPAGKGGADKKAVNFEGGRDLDSMVQFIEENATNEFELEEDDEGKDEL